MPNRKIQRKERENRGRFTKAVFFTQLKKDILNGTRVSNSGNFQVDACFCCLSPADDSFVNTPDYTVVCKKCAAVQPSEIFYDGAIENSQKLSPSYKKRTYLSERIRLFGNREPRIPREDLTLIGQVYSEIESVYSKIIDSSEKGASWKAQELKSLGLHKWFIEHSGDITKDFIKKLLSSIDKHINDPKLKGPTKSYKKKYAERWLQLKIFICGDTYYENHVCKIPDRQLLDQMLTLSNSIAQVYENFREDAQILSEKKSMPNIDLLLLIVLYNIAESSCIEFGWYFILSNKSLLDYSEKIKTEPEWISDTLKNDYEIISKILNYLNYKYKNYKTRFFSERFQLEEGIWKLPQGGIFELCTRCNQP